MEQNNPNQTPTQSNMSLNQMQYTNSTRRGRQRSPIIDIFSTLFVVLAALALALLLITFVFQSYQVDGPSMQNTLQNNDRLLVWKVPRTIARITGQAYIPSRGDIIIFNESGLATYGQTNTKQLVKRVIGLPGDHIVIKNGSITIFNKQSPAGFDPDTTLAYGKEHPLPYTSGNIDLTLGKDQIFVCGDNRTDSLDSRIFGPVNASQIIGKLVVRIYPFNHLEAF